MSMNFDNPINKEQQGFIRELLGDKLEAIDEKTALFDAREVFSQDVSKIATKLNQRVTVELNEPGEIKEMSDSTQYRVTPQGWKKLDEKAD